MCGSGRGCNRLRHCGRARPLVAEGTGELDAIGVDVEKPPAELREARDAGVVDEPERRAGDDERAHADGGWLERPVEARMDCR